MKESNEFWGVSFNRIVEKHPSVFFQRPCEYSLGVPVAVQIPLNSSDAATFLNRSAGHLGAELCWGAKRLSFGSGPRIVAKCSQYRELVDLQLVPADVLLRHHCGGIYVCGHFEGVRVS
jgi:hypothetical protein